MHLNDAIDHELTTRDDTPPAVEVAVSQEKAPAVNACCSYCFEPFPPNELFTLCKCTNGKCVTCIERELRMTATRSGHAYGFYCTVCNHRYTVDYIGRRAMNMHRCAEACATSIGVCRDTCLDNTPVTRQCVAKILMVLVWGAVQVCAQIGFMQRVGHSDYHIGMHAPKFVVLLTLVYLPLFIETTYVAAVAGWLHRESFPARILSVVILIAKFYILFWWGHTYVHDNIDSAAAVARASHTHALSVTSVTRAAEMARALQRTVLIQNLVGICVITIWTSFDFWRDALERLVQRARPSRYIMVENRGPFLV